MATLLLVEDEAELRDCIAEVLADFGHEVTVAEDGVNALQRLEERSYDVLISDVSLPQGVSGIALAEHFRGQCPAGRVILVSGHSRAQLPPLPANVEYLAKPYRIQQLMDLLAPS